MSCLIRADAPDAAARTAAALRRPGAVVLVPTETVYGLVGRAADPAAAERIYQLKRRPSSKRLGWFVADWRQLASCGALLDGAPARLAARYLPGPLTLIVPTADGGTIGFRSPDHFFLREVLALVGEPLVQTSANCSGRPDARSAADAIAQLAGEVDLAVDAGALPENALASTVVDASCAPPRIVRQGALEVDLADFD